MKKLGLGCMRLPLLDPKNVKSIDFEQVTKMVDSFLEQGFTYFDTAYFYHNYESERVVKRVLVDRYPRDQFVLATKLPCSYLKLPEDADRFFEEQLEKTGAGFFDYYLFHCLTKNIYETVTALGAFSVIARKKEEGKIGRLGFSFHDSAQVLDQILTEHPEFEFVQLQINYLDWEHPDVQSRKCYEVAKAHNKDIIVMEPVKGGALASVPEAAEKLFKGQNDAMSIPSWAIRFAASLENVIVVLSGMSNMEQLLDNTSYMKNFIPLSKEERKLCLEAAEIVKKSRLISCTACQYCVEKCPEKIVIPEYFQMYNRFMQEGRSSVDSLKKQYSSLISTTGSPENCIDCKQCEANCPQHLPVTTLMKKALEPLT